MPLISIAITPNDAMSGRLPADRAMTAFLPKGHAVQSMSLEHLCLCVLVLRYVRVWRSFAAPFPQNICKSFGGDFLAIRGFPYFGGELYHFAIREFALQLSNLIETIGPWRVRHRKRLAPLG